MNDAHALLLLPALYCRRGRRIRTLDNRRSLSLCRRRERPCARPSYLAARTGARYCRPLSILYRRLLYPPPPRILRRFRFWPLYFAIVANIHSVPAPKGVVFVHAHQPPAHAFSLPSLSSSSSSRTPVIATVILGRALRRSLLSLFLNRHRGDIPCILSSLRWRAESKR